MTEPQVLPAATGGSGGKRGRVCLGRKALPYQTKSAVPDVQRVRVKQVGSVEQVSLHAHFLSLSIWHIMMRLLGE